MLCEPIHRSLSHYLHAVTLMGEHIAEMGDAYHRGNGFGMARSMVYNSSSFSEVIDIAIERIFAENSEVKNAIHNMSVEFNMHQELRQTLYQ